MPVLIQDWSHYADVDSRSGALFCQFCQDFVWDPTLEELRVRKIGTGSFSSTFHDLPRLIECRLGQSGFVLQLRRATGLC